MNTKKINKVNLKPIKLKSINLKSSFLIIMISLLIGGSFLGTYINKVGIREYFSPKSFSK
tara:strand:- start:74 stop:253 length:180 start_codon:yes stop_codon:yes gene_type:complete